LPLAERIALELEACGTKPPELGAIRERLAVKPQIFAGLLDHLVATGRVLRLSTGFYYAAAALETLREQLFDTGWERFDVRQFKQRFGISSKWAIPLLEALDARGATVRDGSARRVLGRSAPPP
jgi:selenocysteine-specific elongation factor